MKESFEFFYKKIIPVQEILIDSVYRRDENNYPEVFFENYFAFEQKIF